MDAEERTMSDQAQRTVLVVEDEEALAVGLRDARLHGGFEATVVGDGVQGLEAVRTQQPDLLVLDLMLPGMSGLEVLKALRAEGFRTRVLIVTALADEEDLLRGFQAGADDYLVKPFGLRELVARCRALLRRTLQSANLPEEIYSHANLTLYVNERRVTRDGQDLNLSPKEYKILELFIQHPKRVWSRDQLLEKIWGLDFVGDTKTVDVHIRWLREKIEEEPSSPLLIRTVRGFGYRFG